MATATAPGPVYDNSLRLLARRDLARVCGWLGLHTQAATMQLAESLPAATHQVDLLAEIGPQRLTHVEFERIPRRDLAHRMLEYRPRIMNLYPGYRITQRVVVALAEHLAQLPEKQALHAALHTTTIDELAALTHT
jgi:hypothetical protein